MLPKPQRLTKKNDFEAVFKKGKGLSGSFLAIKVLKSPLQKSRFGFIVGKKVSLKATVRNRVRRRLQNATVKELDNLSGCFDMVIVALPASSGKKFNEIQNELVRLFKKVK